MLDVVVGSEPEEVERLVEAFRGSVENLLQRPSEYAPHAEGDWLEKFEPTLLQQVCAMPSTPEICLFSAIN
jgi:hypothetical protein